jgi:hypothetical protein
MTRAFRRSSRNRKNQSRFEELDLRLSELARVLVRFDHFASSIEIDDRIILPLAAS